MIELRINPERLWESLMRMAEIGATEKGGCCRLALSDEDKAGRDLFVAWAREAGCDVSIDAMGNIFARRPGRKKSALPIATGSHLDTQPTGGRFDGAYGVLAGLEVVRALNDAEIETKAPLEIVVWTNEEGTRFPFGGSSVFVGQASLQAAYAAQDVDGLNFAEELDRIGYRGQLPCGGRLLDAYFEAHIEQGPVLEATGETIGVVTGARGQARFDITVTGMEAHAGTTPMPARKDALVSAAELIRAFNHLGLAHAPSGVCTVGRIACSPNVRNTIPGRVDFTIDLRHPERRELDEMILEIRALCRAETERTGVIVELRRVDYEEPVEFDPKCIATVRDAAEAAGHGSQEIFSGAGHDACYLARLMPVGMLFIPCKDGLSHSEQESATPEDCAAGTEVLLRTLLKQAKRA